MKSSRFNEPKFLSLSLFLCNHLSDTFNRVLLTTIFRRETELFQLEKRKKIFLKNPMAKILKVSSVTIATDRTRKLYRWELETKAIHFSFVAPKSPIKT